MRYLVLLDVNENTDIDYVLDNVALQYPEVDVADYVPADEYTSYVVNGCNEIDEA